MKTSETAITNDISDGKQTTHLEEMLRIRPGQSRNLRQTALIRQAALKILMDTEKSKQSFVGTAMGSNWALCGLQDVNMEKLYPGLYPCKSKFLRFCD